MTAVYNVSTYLYYRYCLLKSKVRVNNIVGTTRLCQQRRCHKLVATKQADTAAAVLLLLGWMMGIDVPCRKLADLVCKITIS